MLGSKTDRGAPYHEHRPCPTDTIGMKVIGQGPGDCEIAHNAADQLDATCLDIWCQRV